MRSWIDRLLERLRLRRARDPRERGYALDGELSARLEALAQAEQRLPEQVASDLLKDELERRLQSNQYWQVWSQLSPREQDVTALTCLGFTNRRIAARLALAPDTVKTYARQVQYKFAVHSKQELRLLLKDWDFSAWGE